MKIFKKPYLTIKGGGEKTVAREFQLSYTGGVARLTKVRALG